MSSLCENTLSCLPIIKSGTEPKITKWITYGVAAVGAGAVVSGLVMLGNRPQVDEKAVATMSQQQVDALAAQIMESKCADCHGQQPKYNALMNLASCGLMGSHVRGAQRSFTMVPDETVRPALNNLLKMDYVLSGGHRMPPLSYSMIHWGSALTRGDIALLQRVFSPEVADAAALRPIEPAAEPRNAREAARIMLGHLLFNDPRLSTNNRVACASCHDLTKGGTDNKAKSEGVEGADGKPQHGGVNAPTVYNAEQRIREFWDGRAADLKEQAGGPPLNPVEMGYAVPEDWQKIAEKLAQDNELVAYFSFVYPEEGITGNTITDAIAAYEKTLVTQDCAFDRYLKGDAHALTDEQLAGLAAFKSAGCATCHSGATMGGSSFEYINTFADLRDEAAPARYKEGAYGLADYTKRRAHRDLFRVPTLRNVALTAPYFHTGTVDSLEDAVRIMFRTQTDKNVDEKTVKAVTSFLEAQTGELNGIPLPQLKPEDVAPEHITVAK